MIKFHFLHYKKISALLVTHNNSSSFLLKTENVMIMNINTCTVVQKSKQSKGLFHYSDYKKLDSK